MLDTPDLADFTDEVQAQEELERWKVKLSPEPHLIVFVIRRDVYDITSGIGRYFRFRKLWGANSIRRRLVVLFTFPGEDIDDVRSKNDDIQCMLREAGKRYFVFNKTGDDKDEEKHLVHQIFKTAEQLSVYIPELFLIKNVSYKFRLSRQSLGLLYYFLYYCLICIQSVKSVSDYYLIIII